MKYGLLLAAIMIGMIFAVDGCSEKANKAASAPPPGASTMPVSKTYPDRYEIREVRNGIVEGTVLLDRESGRVWMMEEGGTGQSRFETFEEMAVVPQPCAQASPSGNGMCKP